MDVERVAAEWLGAPGAGPARLFGARGRAECDAYAAAVTDRERARYAFCA
jgi:hypothetical protein